ncbi:MAG: S8 family serine peptidase [Pyrinomonadaceae bacterium]|nr:S8 family serine peptidase [Pyrinomonadaceae bacterium]MCX7639094.1 S8 family serine peptidase [Pyrinomonadaceae bacterium]MDW8303685.1 S8 family serine peptidase [Acidobacteriota bacterium]
MAKMTEEFKPSKWLDFFLLDESWKKGTGKNVEIAIIDSGIEVSHPRLKGKIIESVEAYVENNKISFRSSDGKDSTGHGTACAGIITSIAPEAKLYSIKVLDEAVSNDARFLIAGLEYAIRRKFRLINLSVGTTKTQYLAPLHELLDRAYQIGSIIVAAANNLPQPSYPSAFCSSLISVRRSNEENPFNFGFHYGETTELTAPGVNILSCWQNGSFKRVTGNSFACSHIVGIIALILEKCPILTPFQVKTILYEIARKNKNETSSKLANHSFSIQDSN